MTCSKRLRIWLHSIALALAPASVAAAPMCSVAPMIAPATSGEIPNLTADFAIITGDFAIATGDVRMEWKKQALEAPKLRFNRDTSTVIALQGLLYRREGISLDAETARVDIDGGAGMFMHTHFSMAGNGGHGQASKISWVNRSKYRLSGADYTTCPGPEPAWRLSAETIELNRETGRGEAFDTVLRFFGVPVFYTPYLNFPIDDKRHTGFLNPTVGFSDENGFELATPFYLNLAPGRDATITPRLLTDRGFQIAGQFRYLNAHSKGTIEVEALPSDDKFGDDRELVHFQHIGRLTPNVALDIDYGWASDDQYFNDLGSTLARTSHSQIEQSARLTVATPGLRFALMGLGYQTMADAQGPFANDPYSLLPAAQLSLISPRAPLRFALDIGVTRFRHDQTVQGARYHLQPSLRWQIHERGWFVETEASYAYTRYDLDAAGQSIRNRGIPSFSIDAGLRFQRQLGNGWIQTLEPRAKYLYTGYEDQTGLPIFDTGTPDLHYHRLFADNRFSGIDRIGDANQIALGLTSRFIEPESGRTVVRLDLGRVYGFTDLRVQPPTPSPVGFGDQNSDIVANLQLRPADDWYTGAATQYDPSSDRFNRSTLRAGYHSSDGRRIDLAYLFFRNLRPLPNNPGFETLEQTQLTAAWPITDSWQFIGRWNYSLEKGQSVNTLLGLAYRASCCWAIRGAWHRVVDERNGNYDTAIMLQIELTGLARFGDDIDSLLQHDIVSRTSSYRNLRFP